MRLTDLAPRWASQTGRHGQGVNFLCPCGCERFIGVAFTKPLDGGAPLPSGALWEREGETFETLTVSPSIRHGDHWHGYIRNGEVLNA